MPSAVIIGAGEGGLICGSVLSSAGVKVTVLEQGAQIGGCLQSFRRKGFRFDTGFHYAGALGEGEALNRLFAPLGLMDLPWVKQDISEEVILEGQSFYIPNGLDAFRSYISELFPREKDGLERYISCLSKCADAAGGDVQALNEVSSWQGVSAKAWIDELFHDAILKDLLCAMSLRMEMHPNLPLYEYAQINASFIQGSWKLNGHGSLIADRLSRNILSSGGEVFVNKCVTSVLPKSGGGLSVHCIDGEQFDSDYVIADIHPASLCDLCPSMRRSFSSRIKALDSSMGVLTVNLGLKEGMVPHLAHSIHMHDDRSLLWDPAKGAGKSIMVHFGEVYSNSGGLGGCDRLEFGGSGGLDVSDRPDRLGRPGGRNVSDRPDGCGGSGGRGGREQFDEFGGSGERDGLNESNGIGGRNVQSAKTVDILTPAPAGLLTAKERRDLEEACIRLAGQRLPGLEDAIAFRSSSTPSTYERYMLSPAGCAFGTRKDYTRPAETFLSVRTPIQGLLLTGASVCLHGLLGVGLTAMRTCAHVLDNLGQTLDNKHFTL